MVKANHTQLAKGLLQAYGGLKNRHFEWAFLYGSIAPDCNPLSYFKGSVDYNFLHGHNYVNARRWVFRAIRRLQKRTHWSTWDYYTLGKITHYLGDAFIYPHNEHYPHGPVEHRLYEVKFRSAFKTFLQDHPPVLCQGTDHVVEALTKLHFQYMSNFPDLTQDMAYIVKSTLLVMASCLPTEHPPVTMQHKVMKVA